MDGVLPTSLPRDRRGQWNKRAIRAAIRTRMKLLGSQLSGKLLGQLLRCETIGGSFECLSPESLIFNAAAVPRPIEMRLPRCPMVSYNSKDSPPFRIVARKVPRECVKSSTLSLSFSLSLSLSLSVSLLSVSALRGKFSFAEAFACENVLGSRPRMSKRTFSELADWSHADFVIDSPVRGSHPRSTRCNRPR